jgi:hypothetical protein
MMMRQSRELLANPVGGGRVWTLETSRRTRLYHPLRATVLCGGGVPEVAFAYRPPPT